MTVVVCEAVWPLSSTALQVTVMVPRSHARGRQGCGCGVAADREPAVEL